MIQEKQNQKVDFKVISNKCCTVCNKPLKKNSELKNHTKCYVCFKVSQGKLLVNEYKIIGGQKVLIKKIDLKKLQLENMRIYRN